MGWGNIAFVLLGLILSIVCVRSKESRSVINIASTAISVFLGAVDGGNCYTRLVSYFRVVRKLIINLTSKEFDILFITKPKGVFTYELYRQNLPNYIESVAGIGYKFKYL